MSELTITLIILGFTVAMVVVLGYYFTSQSFKPNYWTYEKSYDREVEFGVLDPEAYDLLDKEPVVINSTLGGDLTGVYIKNGESKDTVIVCHGYGCNLYSSVKYMDIFYDQGFNVLIYDHRGHGHSDPSLCSMGYMEKVDLKTCVDYVVKKNGREGLIGTHGESMGGATVLMHAAIDDRVDFVVADCPFANLWDQFSHILKEERHLPTFPILQAGTLVSKFRIGAFFSEINPIDGINKIKAPILFIHGANDTYIPPKATQQMYDRRSGDKQLYYAEASEHARSFFDHPEEYSREVKQFLKTYNIR